jgi:hypothetical protein
VEQGGWEDCVEQGGRGSNGEQYRDSEKNYRDSVGQYGGGQPSHNNWIDLEHVDANQPTHWQSRGDWNTQISNATAYVVENEECSEGVRDDDNMSIGLNLNGKYFYQLILGPHIGALHFPQVFYEIFSQVIMSILIM